MNASSSPFGQPQVRVNGGALPNPAQQAENGLPSAFNHGYRGIDLNADISRYQLSQGSASDPGNATVHNYVQAKLNSDNAPTATLNSPPPIGGDGPIARREYEAPAGGNPTANVSQESQSDAYIDSHSQYSPLLPGEDGMRAELPYDLEAHMERIGLFSDRQGNAQLPPQFDISRFRAMNSFGGVKKSQETAFISDASSEPDSFTHGLCMDRNGEVFSKKLEDISKSDNVIGTLDKNTGRKAFKGLAGLLAFEEAVNSGKVRKSGGLTEKEFELSLNVDPSSYIIIEEEEWDSFFAETVMNYNARLADEKRNNFMEGPTISTEMEVHASYTRELQKADRFVTEYAQDQLQGLTDRQTVLLETEIVLEAMRRYNEDQKEELMQQIKAGIIKFGVAMEMIKQAEIKRKEGKYQTNIDVGIILDNALNYLEYRMKLERKIGTIKLREHRGKAA